MPLLENLAEGFANAAGATGSAQAIEKNKAHRQQLSDTALEDTIQAHADVMKGLQAKLGADPNNADVQKQLSTEREQLFNLLHSHEQSQPGRVAKLFRHVFRQGEPQQPVNNLPSVAALGAAAPVSQVDQEMAGLSPEEKAKARRIKFGLEPRATGDKPDPENWTVVTGVDGKGQPFTFQHNSKSGESQTLDGKPIPPEQLRGFTVPPKGSGGPKVGSFGEFLTQAYGPHPTAQQQLQGRSLWAQANAGTTVGEHVVMVPQNDGSIKPVTIVTTSHKEFGGASSAGKATKTPGEQKKDLAGMTNKAGAGVVSVGDAIGGKRTTEQNKASNDFVEATKLASLADQVAQKPDDAYNQKRLAVSLERAAAGRFTTQALEYIIKVGWGATIEQWVNNPRTGALPKELMRQMVDGAHENLNAAKAARDAAFAPQNSGGGSGDEMISVQIPGQPPGKIHKSQKDAFLKKYPNATVQ